MHVYDYTVVASELFDKSDLDASSWAAPRSKIAVQSKREDIFPSKEHESHYQRQGCAADKFYDPHPNASNNIFAQSRSSPIRATNFSARSTRFKADSPGSRKLGPAHYKLKRSGVTVKNPHLRSSAFGSKVDRFSGQGSYMPQKKEIVDFWGWNYKHLEGHWKSNGGGNFARCCTRSRFER